MMLGEGDEKPEEEDSLGQDVSSWLAGARGASRRGGRRCRNHRELLFCGQEMMVRTSLRKQNMRQKAVGRVVLESFMKLWHGAAGEDGEALSIMHLYITLHKYHTSSYIYGI